MQKNIYFELVRKIFHNTPLVVQQYKGNLNKPVLEEEFGKKSQKLVLHQVLLKNWFRNYVEAIYLNIGH